LLTPHIPLRVCSSFAPRQQAKLPAKLEVIYARTLKGLFLAFLLLLIHPVELLGQVTLERLRPVRVFGIDYLKLDTWAEACQMKRSQKPGEEEVLLTNRWAKLQLKINSRKAQINGIVVYLSNAIVIQNGAVYISLLDLRTLIHPVLFPARSKPPRRIKVVALDPGHGGKDPGNQEGSQLEKDYTLRLAKEIRSRLSQHGIKVVLTRDSDKFIPLERRPAWAGEQGADVLLSLHFNATSRPDNRLKGVEVYCLTPEEARSTAGHGEGIPTRGCLGNRQDTRNALLAYQVHKSMVTSLDVDDLGLRRARWMVLRNAEMPAILIEGGYMSDPQEARRIYSPTHCQQLAQAIIDGLLAYKRLVER
jgi:N-acetylmuramoyl-L-alanine amidase